MHRCWVLAVASAATISLSSCGSNAEPSAPLTDDPAASSTSSSASSTSRTPTTTAQSTSQQVPPPAGEAAYVAQLEASGIIPRYGSAEQAVELGRAICERYGTGAVRADVIATLLEGGMTEADAGSTNAVAIVAFCPVFGPQITG
jgi:hypothetical protein